jgi:hypothetical protein
MLDASITEPVSIRDQFKRRIQTAKVCQVETHLTQQHFLVIFSSTFSTATFTTCLIRFVLASFAVKLFGHICRRFSGSLCRRFSGSICKSRWPWCWVFCNPTIKVFLILEFIITYLKFPLILNLHLILISAFPNFPLISNSNLPQISKTVSKQVQ